MNITRENIDELNAVVKVKVEANDYLPKVESTLKEYQRKDETKGFRPGKIPAGLIRKKYRKSVVADAVYKVLTDSMTAFVKENKSEMIGNPIPMGDKALKMDWENAEEFEFIFEVGLAPKFELGISKKNKFEFNIIKINDEFLNLNIKDATQRFGKVQQADISQSGDLVYGDFVELDAEGKILAGGIFKTGSIFLDKVTDEATKKSLIGLSKEDKVSVNPQLLSDDKETLATMLGIDKATAEALTATLQFTLKGITRMVPAEMNQDLFDKVFGVGAVTGEEEFKARFKKELEDMLVSDSETKLYNDVYAYLMETVNISLPDEYLKRWIVVENEKDITAEEVEADYERFAKGMKWQLIEAKIANDHNVSVTKEEMIDFTQRMIHNQYMEYSPTPITEVEMEKALREVLGNEKEVKQISDKLYTDKIKVLYKTLFTLENKEVDYNDFFNVKK